MNMYPCILVMLLCNNQHLWFMIRSTHYIAFIAYVNTIAFTIWGCCDNMPRYLQLRTMLVALLCTLPPSCQSRIPSELLCRSLVIRNLGHTQSWQLSAINAAAYACYSSCHYDCIDIHCVCVSSLQYATWCNLMCIATVDPAHICTFWFGLHATTELIASLSAPPDLEPPACSRQCHRWFVHYSLGLIHMITSGSTRSLLLQLIASSCQGTRPVATDTSLLQACSGWQLCRNRYRYYKITGW